VRDLTGAEILSGRARQQGLQRMGLGSADASIMDVLLSHAPGRTRVLTRDLVLHALEALLRLLARSGPALAAVEDVHLLDLAERDLLPSLSRICSEEPLLVLLSSSESPPPELRRLSPGLIQLPRLTREAQEALVAERLGVRELDPRLTRLVYDATAGNPFYTMEYLKVLEQESLITLVDGRATLQDPLEGRETPQSLRILNAARIDGLEERARGMLKLAATLGRRFPVALLLDAAAEGPSQESEPERIRNLQSLLEGAFLRRCRDGAHLEFRDAALHEAAARCTLGSQRRRLHRRVAEAMLRVHARDLDAHFESLADHAAAGGLLGLAVETIHRAGELHREEGELEQALRCHEKGLAWLEDASPRSTVAPDPLDPAEEGSDGSGGSRPPELETGVLLRLRAGEAALRLGLVRKAEHHLQIALDEANDAGLVGEEGECCLALATLCRLGARRVEAQAYLDQALEAASASLPEAARLRILLGVGDVLLRWGRLDDAEAHFGEIVSEAGETAPGESSLVAGLRPRALLGLAEVAMRRDHVERAEALLIEALTEAGERQDPLLRLGLECAAARAALLAGRVTEALGRHRSALEGLQRTGARPEVARELLEAGRLVFAGGDDAHAAPLFEDLLALGRALGSAELEAWAEAFLALLLPVGDAPQGFACLERCLAFARRLEDPDMFSGSLWLRARWMAEHGEEDQCRGDFDAAQALARASGLDALARSISEDARRRVRPGDSRGPT
jgi:tetratricopeptide (TPR) repeat protein